MSTKTLQKQLFAAIAMVLVSAIALSSSTYAWFAQNTKVEATAMNVTAKSNSQFLLIGDDADNAADAAKTDAAGTALTLTHAALYADVSSNADKKVYPTYYSGTETTKLPGTADTDVTLPTMTADTWYTANNKLSNAADTAVRNVKTLSSTELGDYRLTYKAWLTLSNDSEDYVGTIKLVPTIADGSDGATSVAVKIGTKVYKLNEAGATNAPITAGVTTTENITLTKSTAVPVEIYVFINGASENVNSDYVNGGKTITGSATVSFELTNAKVS